MNTVTQTDIDALISTEESIKLGTKTTAVVITLKNGFEVVGLSACVDPKTFNQEIGTKFARQRAIDKVWELAGYALQVELSKSK